MNITNNLSYPWRIYLSVGFIGIIFISALFYSFDKGARMTAKYATLVDAAMEIKLEATTAHLWFEETISGDRFIEIEEIWKHMDEAKWYVLAMLEGGENKEGKFLPVDDLELRREIEQTLENIKLFRLMAEERWNNKSQSGIGSDSDQRFDKVFNEFIKSADNVESSLQLIIEKQLQQYNILKYLLIISIFMLGIFIGVLLYRYEKRRENDLQTLQVKEENLRITLNSIGDAVISTDINGDVTRMNPIAENLTGWNFKEATGKSLTEVFKIVNSRTKQKVENPVSKILENGIIVGLANHTMLISKDGTEYQIADSGAPIKDAGGNITGVVLVFRDVTKEYAIRKSLDESETSLSTLMSNLPGMAYQCKNDEHWTMLYVNNASEELTGYTPNQLIYNKEISYSELIHPDDRALVNQVVQESLNAGNHFEMEYRIISADGEEKWVWERGVQTSSEDHSSKLIEGVIHDISNRMQSEENVREKSLELEKQIVKSEKQRIATLSILSDLNETTKNLQFEIDERKQAEERIKRFSSIFEHTLNEIYLFDSETYFFTQVNKAAQINLGYSIEELKKLTPLDIKPDFTNESFAKLIEPLSKGEKEEIVFETFHQRKDKSLYNVEIHLQLLKNESSTLFAAIILDITERKKAEKELWESRSRYQKLFEDSPVSLWEEDFSELVTKLKQLKEEGITDLQKYLDENPQKLGELANSVKVLNVNKASVELQKAQTKENLLDCLDQTFTEKSLSVFKNEVIAVAEGRDYFESVSEIKTLTQELKIVNVQLNLDRIKEVESSKLIGLVALTDITEEITSRGELEKSRLQLRELNLHAQNIREQERTDISREIHDSLGQALTALKMDLAWIQKKSKINDTEILSKFDGMKDLIDETTSSVQKISTELRPGLLDDLGLTYALDWQCREFEKRNEIKTTLKVKPKNIELSEKISVALFRIVQESLTNVVRHAKATEVVVSLAKKMDLVELKIIDNGIGINKENTENPKSLGLLGITERVYSINGEVSFLGKKEGGTEVKVIVPLENEDISA